jgi:hypothetical protein
MTLHDFAGPAVSILVMESVDKGWLPLLVAVVGVLGTLAAATIGVAGTVLSVWLNTKTNTSLKSLEFDHQVAAEIRNRRIDRLEELHALISRYQSVRMDESELIHRIVRLGRTSDSLDKLKDLTDEAERIIPRMHTLADVYALEIRNEWIAFMNAVRTIVDNDQEFLLTKAVDEQRRDEAYAEMGSSLSAVTSKLNRVIRKCANATDSPKSPEPAGS